MDIVHYIRNNYPHIRQALTTNGYLALAIEDEFCKESFLKGIDEVDVSLDFADENTHNNFRGMPNAFNLAIRTLEICRNTNKSATIVFLGSNVNLNYQNIDGIFKIAKDYQSILRMNMYRPTEGINEKSKQFIVTFQLFVDILKYIGNKYKIIALNDALFSTILAGTTVPDPSGYRSIRILSDGGITPSTYLIKDNYVVTNITEHNVLQKLESENLFKTIISQHLPEECSPCVYKKQCYGGVLDRRYLWYNSLNYRDPYCPGPFLESIDPVIHVTKTNFHSVHDGYLPTIFFSPR